MRKEQDRAGADSSAPARRLEVCLIAAAVTAAPMAFGCVAALYIALRSGDVSLGWLGVLLGATAGLAVIGAIAGFVASFVAGSRRSPLRIGVSVAVSMYAGIVLGQIVGPVGFHSAWYALPIALVGGAIVGLLMLVLAYRLSADVEDESIARPELGAGLRSAFRWLAVGLAVCLVLAEFNARGTKGRRTSSSVSDARSRGVLVRELPLTQPFAYEATHDPNPRLVRIEEAWVEGITRRGRARRPETVEWQQRVVVRLRQGERHVSVWVLTDSGVPAVLSIPPRRDRADSLVRSASVRWAPSGPLQFLTQREALVLRSRADSAQRAHRYPRIPSNP